MPDNDFSEEMLKQAIPKVIESLREELTRSVSWEVKNKAIQTVQDFVVEWVKTNILPEVGNELVGMKDELVEEGKRSVSTMVTEVSNALGEHLRKQLEQSWTRGQIFKAMFG